MNWRQIRLWKSVFILLIVRARWMHLTLKCANCSSGGEVEGPGSSHQSPTTSCGKKHGAIRYKLKRQNTDAGLIRSFLVREDNKCYSVCRMHQTDAIKHRSHVTRGSRRNEHLRVSSLGVWVMFDRRHHSSGRSVPAFAETNCSTTKTGNRRKKNKKCFHVLHMRASCSMHSSLINQTADREPTSEKKCV